MTDAGYVSVGRPVFGISIVMPVCPWPDPNDPDGAPHPHLWKSLSSVVTGLGKLPHQAVEIVVGTDGPCSRVEELVYEWMVANPTVQVSILRCEKAPFCTWGNRQRNTVLDSGLATGQLIVWQDQDDAFFPGALERVVRAAVANPGHPLIFKMQVCADRHDSPPFILWKERGRVERNHIGGHQLVAPNVPALLGRWEPETSYAADFDFIESTLKKFAAAGQEPVWSEEFISMLRPYAMEM